MSDQCPKCGSQDIKPVTLEQDSCRGCQIYFFPGTRCNECGYEEGWQLLPSAASPFLFLVGCASIAYSWWMTP